jgi:hypothetical protein
LRGSTSRVEAFLLGFAAAILVGLAGTARTLVIWLWHELVLLWFVFLFSGNETRQSTKKNNA